MAADVPPQPASQHAPNGERTVVVEQRGAALWLRINRPDAMNAVDLDVVDGLHAGLDQAESTPAVRCVVLTGTGRAFSAGADLRYVRRASGGDGGGDQPAFLRRLARLLNRVEAFPKPVIAAVNGIALAGGLELILCCDLVVAAAGAKMGDAHANYGLLPGGGGSVRLARRIGPTRAKYLMFTGDFVAATELEASGLVNAVVPEAQLEGAVADLAQKLETKSPLGLARMKQLVNDGLEQPVETALRAELTVSELHLHSADMAEGLQAFEEKREPRFTGR